MQELEKILEEIDCRFENLLITDDECRKTALSKHDYEKAKYYKTGIVFTERAMDIVKDIIRKHMNDGWIPAEKFGLPHSNEHDFRFWVTIQYTNGFRHTIKAKWDCFDKCFIHQNGKKILQDVIAYKYYSAPEPYRPERSEE